MKRNYDAFIAAHPTLVEELVAKHGDIDWLKKYTDEKNGRITEAWELNQNGEFVDVTARYKAIEELERAKAELSRLEAKSEKDK